MSDYLPPPENPYAAPAAEVFQTDPAVIQAPMARRFARFAAKVVDGLLFYGVIFLALIPVFIFSDKNLEQSADNMSTAAILLVVMAGGLFWVVLACVNGWFIHSRGQTLGKMALNIKILRSDYSRVSLLRVFGLRFLIPSIVSLLPFVNSIFWLIDPCFIFSKDRRCVHDYIADTIVVEV